MKDKYKITEEEINQTILHSPYSLADSPASTGLKAKQIKKYFYEFIRFFANKINIHLADIGTTLESYYELNSSLDKAISDILLINDSIIFLQEKDAELGSHISESVISHNQSGASHADIREKIAKDLLSHNESTISHSDIRNKLKVLLDKLDVTYSLASGKSRIYSCEDIIDALDTINSETMCKGDLLMVADPILPDFTVFETKLSEAPQGSVELDYSAIASGEMTPEAGKSYYYNGVRLISSIGNMETSLLAKNEDLEALESEFWTNVERINQALDSICDSLEAKEKKIDVQESTASELALTNHTEYNLGLITTLVLSLPEDTSGLEAIVNFRTGAATPTFDSPSELVFSGDDSYEGRFYPITNRLYEINIKDVMGILTARVGATDYEVIE